jgi:hypothetical protein
MSDEWMMSYLCPRWFGRKNLKVVQVGENKFIALGFGYGFRPHPMQGPHWVQITTKTHNTAESAHVEAMAFKAHCARVNEWGRNAIMVG